VPASDTNQEAQRSITGFWSAIAQDYEAHEGNVPPPRSAEHDAWVAAIRDALPEPPSDVLDVGTGTGFVARTAATLGHRVTGIDLSEQMLGIAREHAERDGVVVRFAIGDAVAPQFSPASFDAVTSRHLLWTLREPVRAFANWRALLRPGGRAVAFDGFWFSAGSR
jgi:ubiquinone/menaquinone biosynthesis C-methylase UbiE